ncbi:Uncharacterised protein [Klebsiella oxytoca]|nr:Uncharacterised protein [Klebsiella oxytoca]
MLLAVPAVTASSVWTYWALKLIFSALPALLALIRFSTGRLLASLILTLVPAAGAGALLLPYVSLTPHPARRGVGFA